MTSIKRLLTSPIQATHHHIAFANFTRFFHCFSRVIVFFLFILAFTYNTIFEWFNLWKIMCKNKFVKICFVHQFLTVLCISHAFTFLCERSKKTFIIFRRLIFNHFMINYCNALFFYSSSSSFTFSSSSFFLFFFLQILFDCLNATHWTWIWITDRNNGRKYPEIYHSRHINYQQYRFYSKCLVERKAIKEQVMAYFVCFVHHSACVPNEHYQNIVLLFE